MSTKAPSTSHLESDSNKYIPSIEAFKSRFTYVLLNNRYVATFGGSTFWNEHSDYVRYMVSNVTLPQWLIDNEQVYIGGAAMNIPNGFQQNNIELTLYNTGPELQVMQKWMKMTYNQANRTYGYFDDLKCDLQLQQFTTDGKLIQTFMFYDCTIFQIGGISFSYDPASGPQTFVVSLNYFGFELVTVQQYMEDALKSRQGSLNNSAAKKAASAAKAATKGQSNDR